MCGFRSVVVDCFVCRDRGNIKAERRTVSLFGLFVSDDIEWVVVWGLCWFGVVAVVVIEMGLITPPVGINVFVVKGVAANVPMGVIFRGVLPFWFAMAVCLILLVLFPEIALYLPSQMR